MEEEAMMTEAVVTTTQYTTRIF